MIADELGNKYRVVLTRTDDYSLDLHDRAAVSNNIKADLFISLHTGGSFLHEASGMSLFYFKEISKPALIPEVPAKKPFEAAKTNTNWDNIQNKYSTEGKVLAKLIQDSLLQQLKTKKSGIHGAPLIVLKGAGMPAILIEIGYLTNPVEEKKLNDTEFLSDFAIGISNGINDFFQEKL
jgi:N-acetylmuramoyl-L-alanine amidase